MSNAVRAVWHGRAALWPTRAMLQGQQAAAGRPSPAAAAAGWAGNLYLSSQAPQYGMAGLTDCTGLL